MKSALGVARLRSRHLSRSVRPELLERLEGRTLLSGITPTPVLPPVVPVPPPGGGVVVTPPVVNQVMPVGFALAGLTGTAFSGDVGLLKGLSGVPLSRLTAMINWGDSFAVTPTGAATGATPGRLYFDAAGVLHVAGTHTYAKAGTYPIIISVVQNPPPGSMAPSRLFRIVSSAAITDKATAIVVTPTIGQPFTGVVGKFNYILPPLAASLRSLLVATINWGDGSPASAGSIARNTDGSYSVIGTHTYNSLSTFHVAVTVYEQVLPVSPTPIPLAGTKLVPVPTPAWVRLITQISSTAIVQPGVVATNA
ncbi:MAG: hypothetical protein ACHRHE_08125 [Tepidisphaerales bacterium]